MPKPQVQPEPRPQPVSTAPAPATIVVASQPAVPEVTGSVRFVGRRGETGFRQGDLYSVGISRDGRIGVTGGDDGVAAVWDLGTGRTVQVIATGQGPIHAVAISDDGKWLVTDQANSVRLWEVASGTQRWKTDKITSELRFSPDGTALMTDRQVFDAADGRLVWDAPAQDFWHRDYAVARDAPVVAGIVEEGKSITILAPNGKELRTFGAGTTAEKIAVSPAGDRVAVIDRSELRVFAATGRQIAEVRLAGVDVDQSPQLVLWDDPRYALVWEDKHVVAFDLEKGREAWRLPRGGINPPVVRASPSTFVMVDLDACVTRRVSDGTELWRRAGCRMFANAPGAMLFAGRSGPLELVDASTGRAKLSAPPADGPVGRIAEIELAPDGARFATLSWDDALWLWDAGTATQRRLVQPAAGLMNATMHFLRDGRLAVVTPGFGPARTVSSARYDVDRNAIESTHELDVNETISGVEIDGDRVIVEARGEYDCPRTAFDLLDRAPPKPVPKLKGALYRAIYRQKWIPCEGRAMSIASRDGKRMYVAGGGTIQAWDVAKDRVVATRADTADQGFLLAPDGGSLLVLHDNGPVTVLDARNLRELRRLEGPRRELGTFALSADSTLFAATTPDGLAVWRLADGARIGTAALPSKLESISALAFSPDGKGLMAGTTLGNVLAFRLGP